MLNKIVRFSSIVKDIEKEFMCRDYDRDYIYISEYEWKEWKNKWFK